MKSLLLILLFPSLLFARTVKVAVIDTGLDNFQGVKLCKDGLIDLTYSNTKSERNKHGNNVTHIITDGLEKLDYCVYHIKVINDDLTLKAKFSQGIALAIEKNVDIINYSAGGPDPEVWEEAIVNLAIIKGIKFIAAAGNDHHNLDVKCDFFPACYDIQGLIVVGNKHKTSNYGKKVTVIRNGVNVDAGGTIMTGSSQSTAIVTHETLIQLIKQQNAK